MNSNDSTGNSAANSLARELVIRGRERLALRGDLFAQQCSVLGSNRQLKAVLCGRRSGKTVCAGAGLADALCGAGFDEAVIYAARTRDVAKRLIWAKLQRLVAQHGLGWNRSDSELSIRNERGGYIQVVGLDKPAEIEKLRGIKLRRFIGDEPATYSAILPDLYKEILEPARADIGGDIWLVGTPGPILNGFWHDVSTRDPAWEVHHWTMFDNPHMREPHKFLDEVLAREGWDENEPIVQREYYGRWVADDSAQVYRYVPATNDAHAMPTGYRPDKWTHTVAVDFGVVDDFAWTVLASHPHESKTYVIANGALVGARLDQMADVLLRAVTGRNVHQMAGDPGGGGKVLINEWNFRYANRVGGLMMVAAEKTEKRANIDVLNTELRLGNVLFVQPACKDLTSELSLLPWADEKRAKEHPSYPNNRADSLLYAHRHHYAYQHQAAPVRADKAPDSPEQLEREESSLVPGRGRAWWDQ